MEHLLSAWPAVLRQLAKARHILLLSDYDGTLTPIVERPELATLSEDVRCHLELLASDRHFSIGIVSGRALSDLKSRVGIAGLVYAGNHGLEIEGLGLSFVSPVAAELRPLFRVIHFALRRALSSVRGVLVEDKGLSLSVHYRMVDRDRVPYVEEIVRRVVGPAQAAGKARLTSGKKVHEIRPAVDWNKGKAVRLLMKRYGRGGRRSGLVSLFFGDDITDEDAFREIESYGDGVSVFVGRPNRHSAATYYLRSPEEVNSFLGLLASAHELCQEFAVDPATIMSACPGSAGPQTRTSGGLGYT